MSLVMDNAPPLLIEQHQHVGLLTLNRPQVLNALNLEIVSGLLQQLKIWAVDDSIQLILLRGNGERAFCAGGDIRALFEAGRSAKEKINGREKFDPFTGLTADLFAAEYQLNRLIRFYPKPIIALMHGIVMGGGVGISVHASHAVASEHTLWAMPETGIGLFPDVASSFVLSRLPHYWGYYLGLTGTKISGIDAHYLGLARYYIPANQWLAISNNLLGLPPATGAFVTEAIDALLTTASSAAAAPAASLPLIEQEVAAVFSLSRVEDIITALENHPATWAKPALKLMQAACPLSLKITKKLLDTAQKASFEDCLRLEYRIGQVMMKDENFYEGVRALLVDKDKNPQWQPAQLEDISEAMIARHFVHLGDKELVFK
ncbi:MAG: enoyl-CoA hydratase/isomerase family protein [Alphaproteobacteria bacterium]